VISNVVSESARDTEREGARVAARLAPGDVVLVSGELGAGKTTFVRGAARALGVSGPVTSPTFAIAHRYRGERGVTVAHVDLYRLSDLAEEDPGLLADYLDGQSIAFVEWPALAEPLLAPMAAARVELAHAGGDRREIRVDFAR
jgi:tRNA threonylcarbamoyladenosine biosynthesis protein TsaE